MQNERQEVTVKEKKLFDALSFVDESYIEDADPNKDPKRIPFWWKRLAYLVAAACLMLAVVLPIAFLGGDEGTLPVYSSATSDDTGINADNIPSHLQEYKDSPYYELIERLDAYCNKGSSGTVQNPSAVGSDQAAATEIVDFPLFPDETWAPSFGNIYTPDNPVFPNDLSEGVSESDIIAHTDTHVFYLRYLYSLDAYSANGTESEFVGSFSLEGTHCYDMHLLNGGNEILLMGNDSTGSITELIYLDVSDPANMKEIKRITLSGYFVSSFQSGDSVLIYTVHTILEPDFHEIGSFVPIVTEKDQVTPLPCENIILPESLTYLKYSVLYLFDAKTLAFEGGNAFLGETMGEFYVYKDHVLMATTGNSITKTEGRYDFKGSTTIHYFPYGNGSFERKGSVAIDGYLNTPFSLEEHNGILRVVTAAYYLSYKDYRNPSTSPFIPPETVETTADPFAEESPEMMTDEGLVMLGWTEEELQYYNLADEYSGANLYCISLESFEVVASLERFVPNGQPLQAIWFDGDLIYATVDAPISNQIYTLDLSDLSNITYKKASDEDYYSFTLRYDENTVLTIGYEERWVMKLEIFRETEDGLVLLDQYLKDNVRLEDVYKTYYIDFDKKLFGIYIKPYSGRDDFGVFYILFSFESGKLERVVEVNEEWFGWDFRATYINGYVYMFGEGYFNVVKAEKS